MTTTPDTSTRDAIRLLADAVRRERVPGVLEFRQLEAALAEAADNPTDDRIGRATAAFRALDRDFRQRVINRAREMAHAVADLRKSARLSAAMDRMVPRSHEPGAPQPPPGLFPTRPATTPAANPAQHPIAAGSSFLSALNGAPFRRRG